MRKSLTRLLSYTFFLLISLQASAQHLSFPVPPPKHYICFQSTDKLNIDGKLSESDWDKAEWTDYFIDIIGPEGDTPYFKTRVKMLWDGDYFYFAAVLEEEHIWATLTKRDAVIYYDNDFEIFMDPDGDNHRYMELEINAFNTVWDLFLSQPYRDTARIDNGFDMPNLLTAVSFNGTLNDPSDKDSSWTVEIAIPWKDMLQHLPGNRPPLDQEKWRINFSRVHWDTDIVEGSYKKRKDKKGKVLPEYNWVWSPQWAIAMHQPEFWGQVQFSQEKVGTTAVDFIEDVDFDLKMALIEIYHLQRKYFRDNGHFTKDLNELDRDKYNVQKFGNNFQIKVFEKDFKVTANGLKAIWSINSRSHLTHQDYVD